MLTDQELLAVAVDEPVKTGQPGSFAAAFLRSVGIALVTFLIITAGISLAIRSGSLLSPRAQVVDYRVVACAERVMLAHGDVYRTALLRACEHGRAPELNEAAWSVTPFALPPYAAALLVPFGMFDFEFGRAVWFALLVCALSVTVAALAHIVRRPAFGVALVIVPTFGLVNLFYGETVLLGVAGVALGALAIQRGRPLLAAIAVVFALIEPAIGLPAFVGAFALVPQARRPLIGCAAILAILGVVTLGVAANLEYALSFIPAHEHAEIFARDQYSLTRLAYVLGASEHVASALGSLSYVVTIVLGVVVGNILGRRTEMRALFVLMPLALSMLGGPFVHDYEVTTALLAAIVLARNSVFARIAVALLSIVWGARWQHDLVPALASAAGIAGLYIDRVPLVRAAYVIAVTSALLLCNAMLPKSLERVATVVGAPQPAILGSDLASLPWEWRIRLTPASSAFDRANELEKLPLWLALICLPLALRGRKPFAAAGDRPPVRKAVVP